MYAKDYQDDLYFDAYLRGICYREDCYQCRYACMQRTGDLTIGDYDGKKLFRNHELEKEAHHSLVLVNTNKGEKFFRTICGQLIYEKKDVNDAIENNWQLQHPVCAPYGRKEFKRKYIKSQSFVKAYKHIFQKQQLKRRLTALWFYKMLSFVRRKFLNASKG